VSGAAAALGASAATLWAVFLVGLAGGFGHCVAMCGPISAAAGLLAGTTAAPGGEVAPDTDRPRRRLARVALWQAGYQGGRVLTYTLIGAALGSLGSLVRVQGAIGSVQRLVWLVAGELMIVMGLAIAGVPLLARFGRGIEERIGATTRGWLSRAYGLLRNAGPWAAVPFGMLMGFMPCGFLLSIEMSAVGTSSALLGGATMLAFGLGTVPALVGFGAVGGLLGARGKAALLYIGAAIVVGLGVMYVVRALGVLATIPN
jgi:uncharacterized protein